jgi:predicted nuclease of predicted toxin-antitoxin system
MKLLFDHNLSPSLINLLRDLYPDSSHVYTLGLECVRDTEVWEYAKREGFLIVTKDADFSDLSLLRGFPPKIIWIRRGNCKTADIEAILRNHYDDIEELNNSETLGVLTLF